MPTDRSAPRPGTPGVLTFVALVAAGGFLGGLARTGALELAGPELAAPGLAAVNVLGSGLLGLLVGAASPRTSVWLRPFAGTGILGGFSTYSSAMATLALLAEDRGGLAAAGYLAASLAGCVLAAGFGLALGLRWARGRERGQGRGRGGSRTTSDDGAPATPPAPRVGDAS